MIYGDPDPLANALMSAEPIPAEIRSLLVKALQSHKSLPSKLVVVGNTLPGHKRPGRPKKNSKLTSALLAKLIAEGALNSQEDWMKIAASLKTDDAILNNPLMPFWIEIRSNTKGQLKVNTLLRDFMIAVRMFDRMNTKRSAGEKEPYRTSAEELAIELRLSPLGLGHKAIGAAYDAFSSQRALLREFIDLRDARIKEIK